MSIHGPTDGLYEGFEIKFEGEEFEREPPSRDSIDLQRFRSMFASHVQTPQEEARQEFLEVTATGEPGFIISRGRRQSLLQGLNRFIPMLERAQGELGMRMYLTRLLEWLKAERDADSSENATAEWQMFSVILAEFAGRASARKRPDFLGRPDTETDEARQTREERLIIAEQDRIENRLFDLLEL